MTWNDCAALHDGSNIAAVIVEPVAGSAGVLPPPVGYLERLREICDKHGILLIFDEVITAFGRVGAAFGAERFGVMPDIITTAKGLTNGVIPMGAVLVRDHIYDAFMQGPDAHDRTLSTATRIPGTRLRPPPGIAAMDVYEQEGIFEQAAALEKPFEELLFSFADHMTRSSTFAISASWVRSRWRPAKVRPAPADSRHTSAASGMRI